MFKLLKQKMLTIYLAVRVFTIVGWHCIRGLLKVRFKRLNRQAASYHLRKGSRDIIKAVKAKCSLQVLNECRLEANTPYIFMSNHLSLLDIPVIYSLFPGHIRFIAKKQLFNIPVFGPAIQAAECVMVDRDAPHQETQLFTVARQKLLDGIALWIFPEGTRSNTTSMLPFKLGGFRLAREVGAMIIPVSIVGTDQILSPRQWLAQRHQKIQVKIGKPIHALHYSMMQQPALMKEVRQQIEKLLGE